VADQTIQHYWNNESINHNCALADELEYKSMDELVFLVSVKKHPYITYAKKGKGTASDSGAFAFGCVWRGGRVAE